MLESKQVYSKLEEWGYKLMNNNKINIIHNFCQIQNYLEKISQNTKYSLKKFQKAILISQIKQQLMRLFDFNKKHFLKEEFKIQNKNIQLKRDKNGQLRQIESFTSEEIKQIVLNEKNDTIPTLEDIFNLCRDKIKINIELKGTNHLLPDSIMQLIKKHNMENQIYFSSFYHKFYELMVESQKRLEINAFIKFGFLFSKHDQFPDLSIVTKGHQLNFSSVLAFDEVTTRFLAEARKKGILLCAYFGFEILETEHLYKRLIQLGVTSLITNQPHTLKRFRQKYYMY